MAWCSTTLSPAALSLRVLAYRIAIGWWVKRTEDAPYFALKNSISSVPCFHAREGGRFRSSANGDGKRVPKWPLVTHLADVVKSYAGILIRHGNQQGLGVVKV